MPGDGGPLRSAEFPEGVDPCNSVVILGNELWGWAVDMFLFARSRAVKCCIEHPASSYSWKMNSSRELQKCDDVFSVFVDMCCFPDPGKLTNQPWIRLLTARCPKDHEHAKHLCGKAATQSGHYTATFSQAAVYAYLAWLSTQVASN